MRKLRMIAGVAVLAALTLVIPAGCWLGALTEFGGAEIRIVVDPTARTIAVEEYDVVSLDIVVTSPEDEIVAEAVWEAGDGPMELVAPVDVAGEYTVAVTHHGEGEEGTIEVTESALLTIEPGTITVVSIVPGMIGVFGVVEDDGCEWCENLIGTWAGTISMPVGELGMLDLYQEFDINADGTQESRVYDVEGGSLQDDICVRGTYTCVPGLLSVTHYEIWYYGEWHPLGDEGPYYSDVPVELDGDTLTVYPPFGIPDLVWVLYRQ